MKNLHKNFLRLAFLLAAGTTLSCSHNHAAEEEKHEEHEHEGVIILDPHQPKRSVCKPKPLPKEVSVPPSK